MPSLNDCLQLGELTLRNRNIVASITRNRSTGSLPNALNAEYYAQRALGNAGLIITEGTLISQQGTELFNVPGIWNRSQIKAWNEVVQAVHKAGGQIFCQLLHVGRLNHPDMPEQKASKTKYNKPVYAPSAIPARGGNFSLLPGCPGYVMPTAIPDPRELVSLYKYAAQNAKQAGFDGVELHAGDGVLPHQFLDSTSNQRTDRWGGSIENRARFTLEVVRALEEVWGHDRVGVKLTPCGGLNDVGMSLEETIQTYTHLVQQLDDLQVAYVCLVREPSQALIRLRFGYMTKSTPHDVLETYRHHIRRSFLFLNGGISISEAEEMLREHKVDAVAFGTLWISHPDLQFRIEHGLPVNVPVDPATVIGQSDVDPRRGYVDYPSIVINTPDGIVIDYSSVRGLLEAHRGE